MYTINDAAEVLRATPEVAHVTGATVEFDGEFETSTVTAYYDDPGATAEGSAFYEIAHDELSGIYAARYGWAPVDGPVARDENGTGFLTAEAAVQWVTAEIKRAQAA